MSTSTTTTLAELPSLKGQVLGTSDWFEITQDRVNTFADATDDHQWIHVDVERATAESPFGGPIGHGFLTLSLFVPMWSQILTVTDVTMGVNYGLNKVRFPAPVPVGSQDPADRHAAWTWRRSRAALQLVAGGVIEREGVGQAGLRARVADPALRLSAAARDRGAPAAPPRPGAACRRGPVA